MEKPRTCKFVWVFLTTESRDSEGMSTFFNQTVVEPRGQSKTVQICVGFSDDRKS